MHPGRCLCQCVTDGVTFVVNCADVVGVGGTGCRNQCGDIREGGRCVARRKEGNFKIEPVAERIAEGDCDRVAGSADGKATVKFIVESDEPPHPRPLSPRQAGGEGSQDVDGSVVEIFQHGNQRRCDRIGRLVVGSHFDMQLVGCAIERCAGERCLKSTGSVFERSKIEYWTNAVAK